jgi:hypothetical protein
MGGGDSSLRLGSGRGRWSQGTWESGAPQPETRQVERVRLRLTLGRWEESAGGAALGQRCEVWGVGKGTCVKATQMGSGRDQGLGIWG